MTKFSTNRRQQKPFLFYFHPFLSRRRGSLQFAAISFPLREKTSMWRRLQHPSLRPICQGAS